MDGYSISKTVGSETRRVHVVSFTTWRRNPIFAEAPLAYSACRAMTDSRLWYRSKLLAWVLMPDRWLGLVEPGGFDELSLLVTGLKTNSTRWLRMEFPELGRVWSRDFHEHAVRRNASVPATASHLVGQILRAGLADELGQYPYWDSRWLEHLPRRAAHHFESTRGGGEAATGSAMEALNRRAASAIPRVPVLQAS